MAVQDKISSLYDSWVAVAKQFSENGDTLSFLAKTDLAASRLIQEPLADERVAATVREDELGELKAKCRILALHGAQTAILGVFSTAKLSMLPLDLDASEAGRGFDYFGQTRELGNAGKANRLEQLMLGEIGAESPVIQLHRLALAIVSVRYPDMPLERAKGGQNEARRQLDEIQDNIYAGIDKARARLTAAGFAPPKLEL